LLPWEFVLLHPVSEAVRKHKEQKQGKIEKGECLF